MLLSAITDGTQKSAGSNLSRYLKALERAGIVTRQAQRVPGKRSTFGAIRYCLVRNTGRMAPVYRITAGEVFDPNTGEVFRLEAGEATL